MKEMHEQMKRLYEGAKRVKRTQTMEQSTLARLLNVAQQNVHNWERRGISKEGAIEAQRALGVSATWVLDGTGPMLLGESDPGAGAKSGNWPFGDYSRYETLSPGKKAQLAQIVNAFLAGAEPEKSAAA